LGERVRYDGQLIGDRRTTDILARYCDFVPVCPEVEYGLAVPREPMRLVGDPENPRLITIYTGIDYTEGMAEWVPAKLEELANAGLCGFVFKARSPSCGVHDAKVYVDINAPDQEAVRGIGIFASAFLKRFPRVPVEDEESLRDPRFRENFVKRVFAYREQYEAMIRNHG